MNKRNGGQYQGKSRSQGRSRSDPQLANMYRVASAFGKALISNDKEVLSEIVAYSGGQAGAFDSDLTAFSKTGSTKLEEILLSKKSHRACLIFSGNNGSTHVVVAKVEGNIIHGWSAA
jgi:hypothetical protein